MGERLSEDHLRAWRAILGAHSGVVADAEEALRAEGLPPLSWYDVLWPLHRDPEGLRMRELTAAVTSIGRTGLSRLVDRLEAGGLITRERDPADRRGVRVRITPEGSDLLRRMWPVYADVLQRRVGAVIDAGEAARLAGVLERIAPPATAPAPARASRR